MFLKYFRSPPFRILDASALISHDWDGEENQTDSHWFFQDDVISQLLPSNHITSLPNLVCECLLVPLWTQDAFRACVEKCLFLPTVYAQCWLVVAEIDGSLVILTNDVVRYQDFTTILAVLLFPIIQFCSLLITRCDWLTKSLCCRCQQLEKRNEKAQVQVACYRRKLLAKLPAWHPVCILEPGCGWLGTELSDASR